MIPPIFACTVIPRTKKANNAPPIIQGRAFFLVGLDSEWIDFFTCCFLDVEREGVEENLLEDDFKF